MAELVLKEAGPVPGIETGYTIYVFEKPPENRNESRKKAPRWQRHSMLASFPRARQEAVILFRSGIYQKVEIKQKLFDRRRRRHIDITLKVFENDNKKAMFARRLLVRLRGIFQRR